MAPGEKERREKKGSIPEDEDILRKNVNSPSNR